MNLTAQEIAAALGGRVTGPDSVQAPGPGHRKGDQSLSVKIAPEATGGFVVYSHSGQDRFFCKDYVRDRLGLPAFSNDSAANAKRELSPEEQRTRAEQIELDRKLKAAKFADAKRIWQETVPINQEEIAEAYFFNRLGGVALPMMVRNSGHVRYHPAPYFNATHQNLASKYSETPIPRSQGAIICKMTDALTGKATGIHRTFLTPQGLNHKGLDGRSTKRMLSTPGVVRLVDPVAHGDSFPGVGIGEGMESALAAMVRYEWSPIWATLTANLMKSFPVLPHVDAITIFADADKINPQTGKRTGEAVAEECAQRWADAGREATIHIPKKEKTDFADLQNEEAA